MECDNILLFGDFSPYLDVLDTFYCSLDMCCLGMLQDLQGRWCKPSYLSFWFSGDFASVNQFCENIRKKMERSFKVLCFVFQSFWCWRIPCKIPDYGNHRTDCSIENPSKNLPQQDRDDIETETSGKRLADSQGTLRVMKIARGGGFPRGRLQG